jgi:hypothetical protein
MTNNPNYLVNVQHNCEFNTLLQSLIKQKEDDSNRVLTYAGIGARSTPYEVLIRMSHISKRLEHQLFILYTGGAAEGADAAFLARIYFYKVFMPSSYFNYKKANGTDFIDCSKLSNWNEGLKTVDKYHPAPQHLTPFTKKLMARNAYCVLGQDLKSPVDFVLCWTPNAKDVGGTGQGLRIAKDYNIPIFNLADLNVFNDVLKTLKLDSF